MRRATCYDAAALTERETARIAAAVETAVRQVVEQATAALAVSVNHRLQRIERRLPLEAAPDARESVLGGRPC